MSRFDLPPMTEIVCSSSPGERRAAELRGGRVWGLHWQWPDQPDPTGAIIAVRVTRLAPEARGAFVVVDDAGTEGFIDLARADSSLHEGQRLLAQVTRTPEKGKRLTLSPRIRLAGRYLVYTPCQLGLAASRALKGADLRRHLQGMMRTAMSADEGIIVRAAAAHLADDPEPMLAELQRHRERWAAAQAFSGLGQAAQSPSIWEKLVIERPGIGPLELTADTAALRPTLQRAVGWAPGEPIRIVVDTSDPFASCGAEEDMAAALSAEVALADGARLWCERTRACWTVDVDSGGVHGQAGAVRLSVNRTAAVELARQARLRGIAGSVVVDFLRMQGRDDEQQVIADLQAAFAEDPARLVFNERLDALGLYAFSRQRIGPPMASRNADGGLRAGVLAGLRALLRATTAAPASPQALVLSPAGVDALAGMPAARAEAFELLSTAPAIQRDESLDRSAYSLKPIR
jgi:ribonuclease G